MPSFMRAKPPADQQDVLADVLRELQSIDNRLLDMSEAVKVLQSNLQPTAHSMQRVVDSLQEQVDILCKTTTYVQPPPVPPPRGPRLGLVGGILYGLDLLLLKLVHRHAGIPV